MTAPQGVLYLVATPIGNLGDVSRRAIETLEACELVACEDTRVTAKLLARHQISVPTTSYREENERRKAPELAERIQGGEAMFANADDANCPLSPSRGQMQP